MPRSLHISIKDLQDFPKIPIELMDRLINLVLRYFEEVTSELQVFVTLPVCVGSYIGFKSNCKLDDIDRSRSNAEKQIGTQQVPCQNAR